MSSADAAVTARAAGLRLGLRPGIGPRLRKALLDHFGSAQAVLAAAPSNLRTVRGIGQKLCRAIVQARQKIDVEKELSDCQRDGVSLLVESEEDYPSSLKNIPD